MISADITVCARRELRQHWRRSVAVVSGYAITIAFLTVIAAVLLYSRVVQNITIGEAGTYFATWLPACGDIASLSEEDLAKLARGIIPQVCKSNCENCTGCNKKPVDILNEGFVINTNTTRLLTIDLVEKIRSLPQVRDASPCLAFRFRDPDKNFVFILAGLHKDSIAAASTCCSEEDLVSGNFAAGFEPGKALVDIGFAGNHGLKVGQTINVAGTACEIAGIVNPAARTVKADVFMAFAAAERLVNLRIRNPLEREANIALIESRNAAVHAQAIKDVKKLMKGDSLLTSGCYFPAARAVGLNTSLVQIFMFFIALAAIMFTARIQWASVIERGRQIAILKAIGWQNRVIVLQILIESMLQSVAGSLIGLALGMGIMVTLPVNELLGIDATVTGLLDLKLFAAVSAFAVISGVLAALLPVLVVVRQRPNEILRRTQAV